MVVFTPFGIEGGTTGDRVDALVWALTHLFPSIVAFKDTSSKQANSKQDRWAAAFKKRERDGSSWKTS